MSIGVSPGGQPSLKTVDYNLNTPFRSASGEAIIETFSTDGAFDLDLSFLFFQPNTRGGFDVGFTKSQDTDGDGLLDSEEVTLGTNPINPDTDSDGLSDGVETRTGVFINNTDTGTSPFNPDTDSDGLSDGVETNTGVFSSLNDSGTNPHVFDTDGDGAGDGEEVTAGSNPLDSLSTPPFVRGVVYPTANAGPLVLEDFNGDGNIDIATAGGETISRKCGRGVSDVKIEVKAGCISMENVSGVPHEAVLDFAERYLGLGRRIRSDALPTLKGLGENHCHEARMTPAKKEMDGCLGFTSSSAI